MDLVTGFALLGGLLLVTALAAGLVARAPVSFPMIFLALGLALGPGGVGLLRIGPDDRLLELLAVLTLSLILFLDAMDLEIAGERRELVPPILALGPGTVIVVALVGLIAMLLLHLPPVTAFLLSAILASTDPVVLRDVLRDVRIPASVRRILQVESGANDVVVLPIVLVLIAVSLHRAGDAASWAVFLAKLLVIGPLSGFVVGGLGAWLMTRVDARFGVGREYQSMYGLGLVLAAYALGATVGVDGFLATFAAGLAVRVLGQELCDCFLEFGAAAAEMTMLLAFVLFGAVLSSVLGVAPLLPAVGLALLAVLVVRPLAVAVVFLGRSTRLSWRGRAFIGWFGPRGLTSLLFALLVVEAGVPGYQLLLALTGVVVVASVLLHGVTSSPVTELYARAVTRRTLDEERVAATSELFRSAPAEVPRITVEQLAADLESPQPPLVLDVRSRSQHARDPSRIPGSIRVLPDEVTEWARARQPGRVVLYCT